MFPVLELDGEPFARGMACGRAARTQIGGSVRCYAAMFASCGIDWTTAQQRAAEFRDIIEGGKVVTKSFDNGDRKCSIIYSVEKTGLKKMVEQKK